MNKAVSGLGGAPGVPKSPEHVEKIAAKNRGKKRTPEQIQRLCEVQQGRTPWNKGLTGTTSRPMSEETKEKLRGKREKYGSRKERELKKLLDELKNDDFKREVMLVHKYFCNKLR